MSFRIGCDVDGTIADLQSALRRHAGHQQDPMTHVRRIEDFWHSLTEIEPGSVKRFAALAAAQRWDVIFLTQRPATAGDTTQRQTQRWLAGHGFEWPSVYVVNGSRGRIAEALALDAIIDDQPANCLDVATQSKARPILLWRGARTAAPDAAAGLGIETVFSFAEALAQLQSRRARRGPQLVARFRAAVGV
jgi:hypothetical protein